MRTSLFLKVLCSVAFGISLNSCKTEEFILHGELNGYVIDAETLKPLSSAEVYLNPSIDSTTTSDDGKYLFINLFPGNYELLASKREYASSKTIVTVLSASTLTTDIQLTSIPVLEVSDTLIDFGFEDTELTFIISNHKKKELRYLFGPTSNGISVHPISGNLINDSATITIKLNRSIYPVKSIEESISLFTTYVGGSRDILLKIKMNMVKDIQGNYYKTVKIGNQIWMAENLNTGFMIDPLKDQTNNGVIEKYCYGNNCSTFGGYYQWDEAMQYAPQDTNQIGQTQGVCPDGWHLPSSEEFHVLRAFLGFNAGGKMKETEFTYWNQPNLWATNESGFSARGSGNRNLEGGFVNIGIAAPFWSSSLYRSYDYDDRGFLIKDLNYETNPISFFVNMYQTEEGDSRMYPFAADKKRGIVVRCIKNPW